MKKHHKPNQSPSGILSTFFLHYYSVFFAFSSPFLKIVYSIVTLSTENSFARARPPLSSGRGARPEAVPRRAAPTPRAGDGSRTNTLRAATAATILRLPYEAVDALEAAAPAAALLFHRLMARTLSGKNRSSKLALQRHRGEGWGS